MIRQPDDPPPAPEIQPPTRRQSIAGDRVSIRHREEIAHGEKVGLCLGGQPPGVPGYRAMDLHLENGKNTAIAAGMDPVARVDAAVAAMANGAVAPSDPRQDTACAEQLRSFDAVMALPDDDRLLARLLIRKVQQRVDGFGRVLRMAGAVEHGTDIVKLLGDPARLKAALVWETAQYDLVCRNRSLVRSGKPKGQRKRLRESQLAKLPRDGRYSDQANCLHLHVTQPEPVAGSPA